MALTDLPISFDYTRSRDSHITDHQRLHLESRQCVYSANYSTLQDALDDAVTKARPLIIEPKTHNLDTGLLLNNANNIHIFAYGATLNANSSMSSIFEMRDTTRCSWSGGRFNVPTGKTVDNAVYINRTSVQSSRNVFTDITVEGYYTVGIRVGKQTSGFQCDHMWFINTELIGRNQSGQIGAYIGDGVFGNCLNHTFTNFMSSSHDKHMVVDRTNVYVDKAFLDTSAVTDFDLNTYNFMISNCRSEEGKRFIVIPQSTANSNISLLNCLYNAQSLHSDGKWLSMGFGGCLKIDNVSVVNNPNGVTPNVFCNPGGSTDILTVIVDGLGAGGSNAAPYASAFNLTRTQAIVNSYSELTTGGAVSSIVVADRLP